MAELGRRELVNDPLAITGREQRPERPLALQGVRPPNNGDANAGRAATQQALGAMDGLFQAVNGVVQKKADEAVVNGKIDYMSGVTEQEMLKNGDRFYQEGYRTLQARDTVNNWYTKEAIAIEESAKSLDPASYKGYLDSKRKELLDSITDPNARRVAAAAFEDLGPRLAQNQLIANNKDNLIKTQQSFSDALGSTAQVSANASQKKGYLSVTSSPIAPPLTVSQEERDIAIKTVLGEAAGEGADGMAAVAHVLRNRAGDNRFPSSIGKVALQDKQFSVWNNGNGKEAMRGMAPGNPMYDKAAEIVDAVFTGHHVDPTGGATHYYSPSLMKQQTGKDKPDWWDGEAKGKAIKIGDHVFAGKAEPDAEGYGELVAAGGHVNLDGLSKPLSGVLRGVAGVMGGKLVITSGYRSPDHPVEKAKANGGGEHTHGDAADIDMSSMDDAERKQLVRELSARGAKRFITYRNSPNMLHVDLKDQQGNGQNWFMFDKSNKNMGNAPAWFQEVSKEQPGAAAAAAGHSGTEVQGFIRGYAGLSNEYKATAVADAMRRRLDSGDPSMFTDAGGLGILYELGAKPGEIDEVVKAKQRFDAKQQDKFSVSRETFRNDILSRAEKGEDLQTILQDIDENTGDNLMLDDSAARALAQSAADKIRQESNSEEKKSALGNTDMLNEVGGLFQKIKTGVVNFETAGPEVQKIAQKYGATETDIKQLTAQTFQLDQSYKDGLRAEAERLSKVSAEQALSKNTVERYLSQGFGLSLAQGTKIKGTNAQGQPVELSPQEYGIAAIKDRWAKVYSDAVHSGQMTEGQAKTEMLRKTYLELQNHGVVDKEAQAEIVGGLTGNILDSNAKTGLKNGATQAYDAWLTLKQTPGLKPGYLAQMVGDDYVRSLLETAYTLDAGDLSKEQALLKAHEILNDPNRDPAEKVAKDAVWTSKRDKLVKDMITERLTPGFFESLTVGPNQEQLNSALKQSKLAENYVNARADAYHLQNPNEDAQVSLEKGIQDLQANAAIVQGNIVITRPGRELHKVMGVSGFGPNAANSAVQDYIQQHGKELWGDAYDERRESYFSAAMRAGGRVAVPNDPGLAITYNAESEIMTIDLYKDETKKQTLGRPAHIRVKDIGKMYADKMNQPTEMDKAWNSIFETGGAFLKDVRERNNNRSGAAMAGEAIGGLAGQ